MRFVDSDVVLVLLLGPIGSISSLVGNKCRTDGFRAFSILEGAHVRFSRRVRSMNAWVLFHPSSWCFVDCAADFSFLLRPLLEIRVPSRSSHWHRLAVLALLGSLSMISQKVLSRTRP